MGQLVAYRSSRVTSDTAEALRQLELAANALGGVRLTYRGASAAESSWEGVRKDPGLTGLPAHLSMRPSGREVYLGIDGSNDEQGLATLWGLAVPLGFVPFSRYPVTGPTSTVFHFLGPWSSVGDFLQGEGRGELAWPSMVAAAQCDVGAWEGERTTERTVQTHLHRLGIQCGPIDGVIGERTLTSLRALGLGGLSLVDARKALVSMRGGATPTKEKSRRFGFFTMAEGSLPSAFTSGDVRTIKTNAGFSVAVDGPGRVILLFEGMS